MSRADSQQLTGILNDDWTDTLLITVLTVSQEAVQV